MLDDLLEAINFDLVWFFFWAGFVLIVAGAALIVVTRDQIVIGPDPQIPAVVEPAAVVLPRPPKAHAAPDAPTARIPGSTPVPHAVPQPVDPLVGLRELPSGPELRRFLDSVDAAIRAADEVTEKISSDEGSVETQVVDLCPLTTQDIQVPEGVRVPAWENTVRLSNQSTQELSAAVERAKERAA